MNYARVTSIIAVVLCGLIVSSCSVNIGGPSPTATPANETERIINQLEASVSEERGLSAKTDVPEHFITQPELRENYTKLISDYYTQEEADRDMMELWLLGLVDDPYADLYQMNIDMFSNAIIGYYDTKQKEMFVGTKEENAEFTSQEKIILAHEYVHSLQDQHFDIEGHDKLLKDDSDGSMAYRAVIEGDATWMGEKYARSYMRSGDYLDAMYGGWQISKEKAVRFPPYFSYVGFFPYNLGYDFIVDVLNKNLYDYGKIDDVLKDPPKSTEQILHRDKYLEEPRDNPLPVSLPPLTDTLGLSWTFNHSNTIGEYDLRTLFNLNDLDDAEEAAAGWGGGRYDLYRNGDHALLIMGTRWDTPEDREQFDQAIEDTLYWMDLDNGIWRSYDGRYATLAESGDISLLIASNSGTAIERVLEKLKP